MSHINAQSLLPKLDEIRSTLIHARRPVIFGVTETWLDSTVENTEVDSRQSRGELMEGVTCPAATVSYTQSFKKCNVDTLRSDLENAAWQLIETFDSVDDEWECWKSLFFDIVGKHAPLVKIRAKRAGYRWIDSEL